MPIVRVNECNFYYEDNDFTDPWVESETVWIQHGFGRNTRFWHRWPPVLASDYRVIRRDMRGHGSSDDPGPDYDWSVEGLVSDMMGFMDSLELESVHYVGESIGAMLGVVCASQFPERFKSLTLCSVPGFMLQSGAALTEDNLKVGTLDREKAIGELGVGKWAEALMVPGIFAGVDGSEDRKEWLVKEWDRTPRHVAQPLMHAVRGFDIKPLLSGLRVPTLILAPARSRLQPLASQVRIYNEVANSRIFIIDGPGHEVYFDRAIESASAVLAFLRAQAPG